MSDSDQATPRFETRAGFGYMPLFMPSYQVLRDTGMMLSTSGSFKWRPGKCKAAGMLGAEPVVATRGVEFIVLVSLWDAVIAPSGLLFQFI